ncbi:unnamed protein product [Notodromas monacha]|uniref:Spt20-like SEP domain-containing protein n=1 Tax=Notodromas monacha TaxID=399045 RepID=A0A7R9BP43_9CRUS|nr:unnamed protein product [Notodromas monacha]CAG0917703.1 unnamed protein product [Notodromas monacha]
MHEKAETRSSVSENGFLPNDELSKSTEPFSWADKMVHLCFEKLNQPAVPMANDPLAFNESHEVPHRIVGPRKRTRFFDFIKDECTEALPEILQRLVEEENLCTLIVNLYAGERGYGVGIQAPNGEEIEALSLNYDEHELLDCIDQEEIPYMLYDLLEPLENLFCAGRIVCQVRDYRDELKTVRWVLLQPTCMTMAMDVRMLTANTDMTEDQRAQLESEIIMAQSEPLYLEPVVKRDKQRGQESLTPMDFIRRDRLYRKMCKEMSYAAQIRLRKFLEHEDAYPHRPLTKRILDAKAKCVSKKKRKVSANTLQELVAVQAKLFPAPAVVQLPETKDAVSTTDKTYFTEDVKERSKKGGEHRPAPVEVDPDFSLRNIEEYLLEPEPAGCRIESRWFSDPITIGGREPGSGRVVIRLVVKRRIADEVYFVEMTTNTNLPTGWATTKTELRFATRDELNRHLVEFGDVFTDKGRKSVKIAVVDTNGKVKISLSSAAKYRVHEVSAQEQLALRQQQQQMQVAQQTMQVLIPDSSKEQIPLGIKTAARGTRSVSSEAPSGALYSSSGLTVLTAVNNVSHQAVGDSSQGIGKKATTVSIPIGHPSLSSLLSSAPAGTQVLQITRGKNSSTASGATVISSANLASIVSGAGGTEGIRVHQTPISQSSALLSSLQAPAKSVGTNAGTSTNIVINAQTQQSTLSTLLAKNPTATSVAVVSCVPSGATVQHVTMSTAQLLSSKVRPKHQTQQGITGGAVLQRGATLSVSGSGTQTFSLQTSSTGQHIVFNKVPTIVSSSSSVLSKALAGSVSSVVPQVIRSQALASSGSLPSYTQAIAQVGTSRPSGIASGQQPTIAIRIAPQQGNQQHQLVQQIIAAHPQPSTSVLQQKLTEAPSPRRNAADLPASNPSLTALLAGTPCAENPRPPTGSNNIPVAVVSPTVQGSPVAVIQSSPQRQHLQTSSPQVTHEVPMNASTLTLKSHTPVNFNVISGVSALQNMSLSNGMPVSGFPVTLNIGGSTSGGMIAVPIQASDGGTANVILDASGNASIGNFVSVASVAGLQQSSGSALITGIGGRQSLVPLSIQRSGDKPLTAQVLTSTSIPCGVARGNGPNTISLLQRDAVSGGFAGHQTIQMRAHAQQRGIGLSGSPTLTTQLGHHSVSRMSSPSNPPTQGLFLPKLRPIDCFSLYWIEKRCSTIFSVRPPPDIIDKRSEAAEFEEGKWNVVFFPLFVPPFLFSCGSVI